MKKNILVLLLLFFSWSAYSQISHGGEPLSFKYAQLKKSISMYQTPDFDYNKLILEDEQPGRKKAYRYGKNHEVNLNPENSGDWQTTVSGEKIWQLKIVSKGAYSIGLIFDNFQLEGDARVFIYSADKKNIIGAFTKENNKKSRWLSTVPVAGEELIIELNVLEGTDYGQLNLSEIVHDYKGVFGLKSGFGASGACNVNINCTEGTNWQNEKRAVVKYTYVSGSSSWLCTGALVNNTAKDAKPYLLTAEHCVNTADAASSANFWFNYESPDCSNINPTYQSISSANLISTGNTLDFSLLELSEIPPYDYHAYYAGWNRKSTPATNTTCIHHPEGDIKKISFDNDPPAIANYGSGYVTNSHWNILAWDVGTTEGGSSGSPLFDQNHFIVGDLTGGDAKCDDINTSANENVNDYFARFDMSWDYFSEPEKQLKVWLDPLNSGVETLSGFEPTVTDGLDASLSRIVDPMGGYCDGELLYPKVIIANKGSVPITNVTISYQIDGGPMVQYNWNGSLTTLESDTITFNPVAVSFGEYTFNAFVSGPNNSTDLNLTNDTLVSSFVVDNSIDAAITSVLHPNGAYCAIDSMSPQIELKNAGIVGITKLNINYQINGGSVVTEAWYGNLQTNESEIVTLKKIKLPVGTFDFKAFVSGINCGTDKDFSNDTVTTQFDGQDLIAEVLIDGPSEICYGAYEALYSSPEIANYLWTVQGGEILGAANTLQSVNVKWEQWGVRTLVLELINECNSKISETLEVDIVEHGLDLEMEVGDNGASVCWSIENCDGEVLFTECGIEPNSTYKTKICLPKGCYQINISGEQSGVLSYSLQDTYADQIIVQGASVFGTEETKFILNQLNGLANINIYPNPSTSELIIEAVFIELYEDATFAICNLRGSQITPFNLLDDRKVIDISSLPKGMYLIKIRSSYGNFTKKFLKP